MKKLLLILILAFSPFAHAVTCDQWAVGSSTASGNTQILAAVQGQRVYICSFAFTTAVTTANTAQFQYGTGTACGTGTGNFSIAVTLQSTSTSAPAQYKVEIPPNAVWGTPISQALCLNLSAGTNVNYQLNYTIY